MEKPIIGITIGDYNGIGPEVILKALYGNHITKLCTPVIYGSMRVLNRYKFLLEMKDWQLFGANNISSINPKATNVITCFNDANLEVEPGKSTQQAGAAAFDSLKQATEDLKAGKIQAIVTAPINKQNIQSEDFKFPGHTEYFTEMFEAKESLMFLVSEQLRVGVVTGHIPVSNITTKLTTAAVTTKLQLMIDSLKNDFGIKKPKIAVLGLNPHAGDNGLLGKEDQEIIMPTIQQFKNKGHLIFGPFSADGFFGKLEFKKYDAVLAMYHDQGLIPFKLLAFEDGVNFTAGLSVVRTSPDHGTAYDIAQKNIANESSMLNAIFTALDILKHRTVEP